MIFPDLQMLVLAVLVFVPLERIFALRHEQGPLRNLWKLDTLYLLVNGTLIGFGSKAVLFLGLLLIGWLVPVALQAWVSSQPVWLQLPFLIILADLGFYSAHRMFHAVPWLWKFHSVHHSIEDMDWLAAHRVHPLDQSLTHGASFLPILALGFSTSAIVVYGVLYHWQSLFIHSNIKIELGPLGRIFASPRFHHWHHANHPEAFDKNFAGQLSFLDAIFGTLHMPAEKMPERYGTDAALPPTYVGQLLYPLQPSVPAPQDAVQTSDLSGLRRQP